jgi:predicted dienelactone hydrolase
LPGPFAVGCSNVAQDFSRLAPGEDVQAYWEGVPRDNGSARYATDLLSDPADTLSLSITAPANAAVFGTFAGKSVPVTLLACYPTRFDNPRPAYALPNGKAVPHMQQGSDDPLFADPLVRFPMLLFSHGYLGSPLSNDYIDALITLASYGFVVVAPFHGDGRVALLEFNNFNQVAYLLAHIDNFMAVQALRPLELSASIDRMLSQPAWAAHIDASRIGGFGASLGGESMLLMAGGGLTTSLGLSWTVIENDPRLKAAVGYVPYFGQTFFPAFGRDEHGLDSVTLPYLAISGSADTTAPLAETQQGIAHLTGTRELVALNGVTHGFDIPSTNDIFTWTLTFLQALVVGNNATAATLGQMGSVAGGGDDHVVIADALPAAAAINYSGLWWASPAGSEAGWGANVAHQGDVIFVTWFTYNDNGTALWVSMTGFKVSDGVYSGTIYRTTGPPFSATMFDPNQVTRVAVGTGTFTFFDPNNGFFNYTMNGITQNKPITRQVFGPLPSCIWPAPNQSGATNYTDLWWNPNESGWGINFAQEGSAIFATWFTYDPSGLPLWLSFTGQPSGTPGNFTGTIYRTSGPAFSTVPFDPNNVTRMPVGFASVTFSDGADATFFYDLYGVSQSKSITREVFRSPGTVCQ